jgi:sugar/nucleoside kinase (ribokinase family)
VAPVGKIVTVGETVADIYQKQTPSGASSSSHHPGGGDDAQVVHGIPLVERVCGD